jgi:DNA-binding transcriptional MerR regulator
MLSMSASIPNRSVYRSQEVCEIADVQPYVLKSWEAEFPELGVAKTADGPRIYRRGDVELVLKLKNLLLVDGLTLAGARRRLNEEGIALGNQADEESISDDDVEAILDKQARKGLRDVREGLGYIMDVLDRRASSARAANGSGRSASTSRSKVVKSKARPAKAKRPQASRSRKSSARRRR